MKTYKYKSSRSGFEMSIPDDWSGSAVVGPTDQDLSESEKVFDEMITTIRLVNTEEH